MLMGSCAYTGRGKRRGNRVPLRSSCIRRNSLDTRYPPRRVSLNEPMQYPSVPTSSNSRLPSHRISYSEFDKTPNISYMRNHSTRFLSRQNRSFEESVLSPMFSVGNSSEKRLPNGTYGGNSFDGSYRRSTFNEPVQLPNKLVGHSFETRLPPPRTSYESEILIDHPEDTVVMKYKNGKTPPEVFIEEKASSNILHVYIQQQELGNAKNAPEKRVFPLRKCEEVSGINDSQTQTDISIPFNAIVDLSFV